MTSLEVGERRAILRPRLRWTTRGIPVHGPGGFYWVSSPYISGRVDYCSNWNWSYFVLLQFDLGKNFHIPLRHKLSFFQPHPRLWITSRRNSWTSSGRSGHKITHTGHCSPHDSFPVSSNTENWTERDTNSVNPLERSLNTECPSDLHSQRLSVQSGPPGHGPIWPSNLLPGTLSFYFFLILVGSWVLLVSLVVQEFPILPQIGSISIWENGYETFSDLRPNFPPTFPCRIPLIDRKHWNPEPPARIPDPL